MNILSHVPFRELLDAGILTISRYLASVPHDVLKEISPLQRNGLSWHFLRHAEIFTPKVEQFR